MAIARITEVSASGLGIEDAISNGMDRVVKTLENVEQIWVQDIKALVKDGRIAEYRVNMKVTFVLKE